MSYISFQDVRKEYKMGEVIIKAADGVNFEIEKGEFAVIVGPSGAGKTTVLNMLGGMDTCDLGADPGGRGQGQRLQCQSSSPPTGGTTSALSSSSTTWCRT